MEDVADALGAKKRGCISGRKNAEKMIAEATSAR